MKTKFLMGLMAAPLMFAVMAAPAVAKKKVEVTCADGSTSTAKGRGACSGHGGVKKGGAADAPAKAAEPAPAAAPAAKTASPSPSASGSGSDAEGATAKCKDGTFSHAASHKGACARHGGVEEWMKK